MPQPSLRDILKSVTKAAEAGGKEIVKYFGKVLEITEKSNTSDIRTKADLEAEKSILSSLQADLPNFNIYSEESGAVHKGSPYTVVVDPLDGSNNFVLGIPYFSVSIGVMKYGETVVGVVHAPVINHTYSAVKDGGAFIKGTKLSVNSEADFSRATISYTCAYQNDPTYSEQIVNRLNELNIKRFINIWSPALDYCMLASGKIEGIINNNNELYDYAAGKLIIREAGAKMTDFEGNPLKSDKDDSIFIASNGTKIHEQLLGVVAS